MNAAQSTARKHSKPRGWQEVINEPFPDFKPEPKIWPKGPSMDGIRPVFGKEEFERRRAKIMATPLP
jgi:hypothetical protein